MGTVIDYRDFLKSQLPKTVEELKAYCAIESCSRDKDGVDRVGLLAAEAWRAEGFEIEVLPKEGAGNHIVARRGVRAVAASSVTCISTPPNRRGPSWGSRSRSEAIDSTVPASST